MAFGVGTMKSMDFRNSEVNHFISGYQNMPTVGEKVRALRKEKRWTLEQLAEMVGASKSSLWELENKEKGRPSADRINDLARVFGVTPEFLLDEGAESAARSDVDEAFFRRYEKLPDTTKKQLKDILDILDDPAKAKKGGA